MYVFLSDMQGYITAVNLSCIPHFNLVPSGLAYLSMLHFTPFYCGQIGKTPGDIQYKLLLRDGFFMVCISLVKMNLAIIVNSVINTH